MLDALLRPRALGAAHLARLLARHRPRRRLDARQGYDLQLTRYDDRGWRATFYTTGMEHSPTRDRHCVGADAVARDAAGCVGRAEENERLNRRPLRDSFRLARGQGDVVICSGRQPLHRRPWSVAPSRDLEDVVIAKAVALAFERVVSN